ncbi:TonB-dependent receptor [Sandarakinorhabdus sp. AAP62]|uniref:TonB-dependent receptor n=1 Tax=Sandarakinorhabdus sp. AAP62 TaxID=1248916 RepID=UPI000317A905|nr:TonB-dependent receptor [Sandarakinorhabdus sp. AAP62]
MKKLCFYCTTAIAVCSASTALAQTAAAAPAEDSGIEEIIVTAQRRSENLQRVAVAVSAVSSKELIASGVSDVQNLGRLVPSLVVQPNGGSSTNFYLRGVGSYATNAFAENAIAFNFAEVYVARPTSPLGTFFDLERIEVVKGPQGTLYGRNATGGAINVIPKAPELGDFGVDATAELGNYASKRGSVAVNIPIGDIAAVRVAGQVSDRNGYLSDGYDDEVGQAARISLLVKPNDRLSFQLTGDYFHQGGRGVGSVLVPGVNTPTAPPVSSRIGGADPRSVDELRLRYAALVNPGLAATPNQDGFVDSTFYGVTGSVEADLDFATLTVLAGYRRSEPNFVSFNLGFRAAVSEIDDQGSLEVRLASKDDQRLRYVLGAFLFTESQKAQNAFTQGLISRTTFNPNLNTTSRAIFGQLTYDVAEGLRLVGGARYTNESKSQNTPLRQQSLANPNPPFNTVTGDLDFSKVTWKVGVEYDAGERSLLYANVATGFKAGGFFVAIRNNTFDPETLTAYTIGSKNRFFDNRLQLNVEAFYWDYSNQQIGFVGPVETAPGIFGAGGKTVNAGQARMYGAELELLFQPTPNDRLTANIQYLDSKYDSFVYTAISATGAPVRSGCAVSPDTSLPVAAPARLFSINCSGKSGINAPKWSLNLGYEHSFKLGKLMLTPGVRTRIESSRFLAIEFLPEQQQAAYRMSDLYLTLAADDERWSLTGFVNNAENRTIYASSSLRPVLPVVYNALRPPRTFGIRASVGF